MLRVIYCEEMQGIIRKANVYADRAATSASTEIANRPMSDAELREELAKREVLMKESRNSGRGMFGHKVGLSLCLT